MREKLYDYEHAIRCGAHFCDLDGINPKSALKLQEILKGDRDRLSQLATKNSIDQLLLDYIIPALLESEK